MEDLADKIDSLEQGELALGSATWRTNLRRGQQYGKSPVQRGRGPQSGI